MNDEIKNSLTWRYAVQSFDKTIKIKEADWKVIESVMRLSPSSFGLEPWKFLIITNNDLKQRLREASFGQSQVEDCSHLAVFCARKNIDSIYIYKSIENIAKTRNIDVSTLQQLQQTVEGYFQKNKNHFEHASSQAFLALGSVILAAAMLKIDACPMGGFEPDKYSEILKVPEEYFPVVVCAFGYRAKDDKNSLLKKVRKSQEEIIIKYE